MYLISSLTPFLSNFVCTLDNQCSACSVAHQLLSWLIGRGLMERTMMLSKDQHLYYLAKELILRKKVKYFVLVILLYVFPVRKKEQHLNDLSCVFHNSWKHGSEILKATDPFEALIAICGKVFIGKSLSKFSCSQVAGLMGLVVTTFAPQVYC